MAFNGNIQHASDRCGDTDNPHIMLTLYAGKMPTEPRNLFDDDIKDLFYGFTKIFIKILKCAIIWKNNMSHVKGKKPTLMKTLIMNY